MAKERSDTTAKKKASDPMMFVRVLDAAGFLLTLTAQPEGGLISPEHAPATEKPTDSGMRDACASITCTYVCGSHGKFENLPLADELKQAVRTRLMEAKPRG